MLRFFIVSESAIQSSVPLSTMLSKLSNLISSKPNSFGVSRTILSHSHHHPHHISQ